jgi:hypothetical protein
MTVTSVEAWRVDGVDLNTLAFNISSFSGRSAMPPIRGENEPIPYRPGQNWVEKMWDQKQETLAMWVLGCDEDGFLPTDHTMRAQFNDNLRKLKRLFGVRHRLLQIEKDVLYPEGLLTLSAQAEHVGIMDPQTTSHGTRATFSADLILPDPFWYAPEVTEMLTSDGLVIDQTGDTLARKMQVDLVGPLINPRVTNTTIGVEVRYVGTIPEGYTVTLDTDAFTATVTPDELNVIQRITHSGSLWWMALLDGSNSMTLDNWQGGSVGVGHAEIRYRPPST